jgi:2-C-methyl-D-erythritol 4-phosphate cytidylyltransferase
MRCAAIIPSGGIGTRFNSPIPKQYLKVLGKELIAYTIEIFQQSPLIDEIIIPADESYFDLLYHIKEKNNFSKISKIVKGGKERQDSVYSGLTSKIFQSDDLILVHDAARPLISLKLLEKAVNSANKYDSVVVAIKARDTLIEASDEVKGYVDRKMIYYAQTPQIFRYSILLESFKKALDENFLGTDESMIVRNANFNVHIVEGEFQNFKITTKKDLELFEKLIV